MFRFYPGKALSVSSVGRPAAALRQPTVLWLVETLWQPVVDISTRGGPAIRPVLVTASAGNEVVAPLQGQRRRFTGEEGNARTFARSVTGLPAGHDNNGVEAAATRSAGSASTTSNTARRNRAVSLAPEQFVPNTHADACAPQ